MALAAGSRFGPFEIVSLLGAGGMGEVYRAHDRRLGRDVALKVISAAFAGDRERLERFEREARALASLNHAGIAAIYGIEEVEGVRALVLELVDGETLERRLRNHGRLTIDAALRIARQIADALDAAHDRGFVHRDLKPSNIAITPAGDVKLLDFGIAKTLFDPVHGDAMTIEGTEPGVILGTAAYMSPEQARGQPVNKRTDVWGFGCVLYEMLTGRAPFRGSTWSDTVSLTLTAEPDWSALPQSTPPGVLHLLQRCLKKDVTDRLRGLGDIDLALEAPAVVSTRRTPMVIAIAATAGIAIGIAAALALGTRRSEPAPPAPPVRFEIPSSATFAESGSFALSPDGTRIVFIGTGADRRFRMWERALDSLEITPISGTESEVAANTTLFWSPDGQSIGFYANGAVRRINRGGGIAEIVCRVSGVAVGGSWNTAGDIVVGSPSGGLVRCPASGGEPVFVTSAGTSSGQSAAPQGLHMFPIFLRDGQRLLYFRVSRADPSNNGLYVADLRLPPGQQSQTRIIETGFSAKYVVSGTGLEHILFVRNRNIWSVAFDSDRVITTGEPVQVASSVYTFRDGAAFDASAGVFAYRGGAPDYQMVWRDRDGKEIGTVGDPGAYTGLALSPDATHVALTRENKANRSDQDLWIVDVRRNTTSRFTSDADPESVPVWSADGQSVLYAVGHDNADVRAKALNGAERTVLSNTNPRSGMFVNPLLTTFSTSRNGHWLTVTMDTRGRSRSDIWILDLREGGQLAPVIQQDFDQRQAVLSPDQRWLAYVSNESGADEVLMRPLTWPAGSPPTAGAAVPISRGGGRSPRWRGDSSELFYQPPGGGIVSVTIAANAIGEPAPLFVAPGALGEWGVTSDGQRFLLAVPTETRDLPFTVFVNWNPPK